MNRGEGGREEGRMRKGREGRGGREKGRRRKGRGEKE